MSLESNLAVLLGVCQQDKDDVAKKSADLDAAHQKLNADTKQFFDAFSAEYGDAPKFSVHHLGAVGPEDIIAKLLAILSGKYPMPKDFAAWLAEIRWLMDVIEYVRGRIAAGQGSEVPMMMATRHGIYCKAVAGPGINWQKILELALQVLPILIKAVP